MNSALGLSQLKKLKIFISKRQQIASHYINFFQKSEVIKCKNFDKNSAYHLFIVNLKNVSRNGVIQKLYKRKIITESIISLPINTLTIGKE